MDFEKFKNNEVIIRLINEVISENNRLLFHGEADFQFELMSVIKKYYDRKEGFVRVEHPYFNNDNRRNFIDILITDKEDKNGIAIELKYKTNNKNYKRKDKGRITINKEKYILANQSAENDNCYKVLKDVEKMQYIVNNNLKLYDINIIKGYVIFITNVERYFYPGIGGNDGEGKKVSLHYEREENNEKRTKLFYDIEYKKDKNKFPDLHLKGISGKWDIINRLVDDRKKEYNLYQLIFEIDKE